MNENPPILRTERLYLNRMIPNDADFVHRLNADPEVIRYTGDPPFESVSSARAFLEGYTGYDTPGYGRFAVRLIEHDGPIGWCGLKWTEEMMEVDLGFRFLKPHWNKGYATEASLACLTHGFKNLGLKRIIGRAMHANHASIRVLEKVGMQYWKDELCHAHPAKCYKIEFEQYTATHA